MTTELSTKKATFHANKFGVLASSVFMIYKNDNPLLNTANKQALFDLHSFAFRHRNFEEKIHLFIGFIANLIRIIADNYMQNIRYLNSDKYVHT